TFFDPGWSVLTLRAAVADQRGIFNPLSWYDREPFALTGDGPRYRQVRTQPVPGSARKTFAQQVALLAQGEEVPTARMVLAAVVIHFLATGQRLLPNVYVRCADQTSRGDRVCVGHFVSDGLRMSVDLVDSRYGPVGLASSRKL